MISIIPPSILINRILIKKQYRLLMSYKRSRVEMFCEKNVLNV